MLNLNIFFKKREKNFKFISFYKYEFDIFFIKIILNNCMM